jgi:hypothetical protein
VRARSSSSRNPRRDVGILYAFVPSAVPSFQSHRRFRGFESSNGAPRLHPKRISAVLILDRLGTHLAPYGSGCSKPPVVWRRRVGPCNTPPGSHGWCMPNRSGDDVGRASLRIETEAGTAEILRADEDGARLGAATRRARAPPHSWR